MILVKPSFEILNVMQINSPEDSLQLIETAGRTCYKSSSPLTQESAKRFVEKINKLGHKSVIEHSAMTVRFICDRGVTHELVRHRLCAFSQESTRYCNYKGGVTFVIPPWVDIEEQNFTYIADIDPLWEKMEKSKRIWIKSMLLSERKYISLLKLGWSPQQARSVLPNSLKTEIVVTANFREWNHIFTLRCSEAAHPQMREIMIPLRDRCRELIPVVFEVAA